MDAASQITGALSPAVLMEPRGFIKILEFVLSIFAFATTTSPDTSTTFTVKNCTKWTNGSLTTSFSKTFSYSYPFDLENTCFQLPVCQPAAKTIIKSQFCLLEGSQSSAQFYVFVGVIVFLYCLAALILYVFFDELYRRNTRVVVVDFVVSFVLTLLWIIASSAWAAGLNDVKLYTDPVDGSIFENMAECKEKGACHVNNQGNFASLNVSIIFGFLNFMVWLGNLWFLYKETPWFKVQAKPPTQPGDFPPSTEGGMYQ